MNKNDFIIAYLKKMDYISAKNFALKFNVYFTDYEINFFLPYLKNNANEILSNRNINKKIHTDLDNKINVNSINKLCLLINKLGY